MSLLHDIELKGCAPVPLASYLKALGILRLVAEDRLKGDSEAKGYWRRNEFHLVSHLDNNSLKCFFLESYQPTPIVAPWNGGSGFYSGDNQTGIRLLRASSATRFKVYQETIEQGERILKFFHLTEKPDKDMKLKVLTYARNILSERALPWLDAAVVLTDDGPRYPPLLGTGGNDGRLDFTNNFMQRLADLFDIESGRYTEFSPSWLNASLFAEIIPSLQHNAIGQFSPSAAGGANAESGFDSDSLINPWDFVLMIEGAILFASASVKRLESVRSGILSYPFSVRTTGAGYGSATQSDAENSRAEIWMPLWGNPTSIPELKTLMSEGRAQVGARPAKNGVDFARAIANLGIDRGISSFQRYGFQVRNGLAYFAIPMACFKVGRQPQVSLLNDFDGWFNSFGVKANTDKAPSSMRKALRFLEEAIFSLCKEKGCMRLQEVLIALGNCERTLAKSIIWARETFIPPIPPLSSQWLIEADDGSPEFRLAASLASIYGYYYKERRSIRMNLESSHTWLEKGHLRIGWNKKEDGEVVWSSGDLEKSMIDIMTRRLMKAVQSGASTFPDVGVVHADPGDVSDFIEGRVNLTRLSDLFWGLILIDWPSVRDPQINSRSSIESFFPGAAYALMKLCFCGHKISGVEIPIIPEIHRRAANGDGRSAVDLAIRRLCASGLPVAVSPFTPPAHTMSRITAATLFPISAFSVRRLTVNVLRPSEEESG